MTYPFRKPDIIHTFNTLLQTHTKWVVTYETIIPRTNETCRREWKHTSTYQPDRYTTKLITLLKQDSCLAMIALSQCNHAMQLEYMKRSAVDGYNEIIPKMTVLPPPQEVLSTESEIESKYTKAKCPKLLFVGGDFFRKGGGQIISALEDLKNEYEFDLTIVGRLDSTGDYASHSTSNDRDIATAIIKSASYIRYYDYLPNRQIVDIARQSHIGLLPTLADTYGYSVLEMQACGCPVITTDIRALPEINDKECGWILHVPKDFTGEALYETTQQRAQLKQIIHDQLCATLVAIFSDVSVLPEKALASMERIKRVHDPERYSRELSSIFEAGVLSKNGQETR